jgi:hypothetical protein
MILRGSNSKATRGEKKSRPRHVKLSPSRLALRILVITIVEIKPIKFGVLIDLKALGHEYGQTGSRRPRCSAPSARACSGKLDGRRQRKFDPPGAL